MFSASQGVSQPLSIPDKHTMYVYFLLEAADVKPLPGTFYTSPIIPDRIEIPPQNSENTCLTPASHVEKQFAIDLGQGQRFIRRVKYIQSSD